MNNYYNQFNEDQFLHINNFFNKYNCNSLIKIINLIEKNKLSKITHRLHNGSVINKNRYQVLIFIEKYVVDDINNKDIIDKYFNNIFQSLYPIIINPIINFFYNLKIYNIKLLRISITYTTPGSPDQQIHHDSNVSDKLYYVTIPLHYTPIEMGPTSLFSYKNTKKYHKKFLTNDLKKYNNIGFYKDIKNDDNLIKSKIQNEHFLGDIIIWSDKTFHYGSENKSKSIRKYLFLIFTTNQFIEWNVRLNNNSGIEILSVIKNY